MARKKKTSQKTKSRSNSRKNARKKVQSESTAAASSSSSSTTSSSSSGSLPNGEEIRNDGVSKYVHNDKEDVRCSRSYCFRKTVKYTLFALAILLGEIAISIVLKRHGYIRTDFHDMMSEQVVPHLQSGLEQSGLLPQFNESLYWIRSFNQTLPSMPMSSIGQAARIRPGFKLAAKGAKAKYPIVMVPGFVTSALEVWQGKECAKQLFRQRLWGGLGMVQHFLSDRHCVMNHISLDPMTGKDPKDIRIRASTGFEAADYFAGNYWVWSKLLENLADIGYDGNMMAIEAYDWRLSFPMLEERDGYLTKLKYRIESYVKFSGKKVVLASHSMGGILVHYFFAWVTTSEKNGGGGGGKNWVDKHIHIYLNIAGALLGAPKSASSLMSGEMSDTVILGTAGHLLEQYLGRKVRKDLWNTWGSLWSLLPKGGAAIWNVGGADFYPNILSEKREADIHAHDDLEDNMVVFTDDNEEDCEEETLPNFDPQNEGLVDNTLVDPAIGEAIRTFSSKSNHTIDDVTDFLREWGGGWGREMASSKWHSFDPKEKPSRATWHDVSRTPLPHAPNLKIYCMYGVGLDTERAYYYKRNTGDGGTENHSKSSPTVDPPFILDTSIEDPDKNIVHGVKYANGDGSVPLLSLGYMCADAWRKKETGLNPSKTDVIIREYQHKQELQFDDPMRGGPSSAEHVDVMGNLNMMDDFLRLVSDFEIDDMEDQVVSDIFEIAERIAKHPKGGLSKKRRKRYS